MKSLDVWRIYEMKTDKIREPESTVTTVLADAEYRVARNEFWVLERIRESELTSYPDDISYWKLETTRIISLPRSTLFSAKGAPSVEIQSSILFALEDRHVVKLIFSPVEKDGKEKSYVTIQVLHPVFDTYYEQRKTELVGLEPELHHESGPHHSQKNRLQSIQLVTSSVAIAETDPIFLVFDGHFDTPTRFAARNQKGRDTSIKKLHDVAYFTNTPGKSVQYDKNVADGINNGLFKKALLAAYMRTNKLVKPTLVQKSEKDKLVLKNEIPVTTMLVKAVPAQYQSLYIDKTK